MNLKTPLKEKEKKNSRPKARQIEDTRWDRIKSLLLDDILWAAMFVILLTVILSNQFRISYPEYSPGEIADTDLKAPIDLKIPDKKATERRKEDARKSVLPVYDYDSRSHTELREEIQNEFAGARAIVKGYLQNEYGFQGDEPQDFQTLLKEKPELKEEVIDLFSRSDDFFPLLEREDIGILLERGFSNELEEELSGKVSALERNMIVARKDQLKKEPAITVKDIATGREVRLDDYSAVRDVSEIENDAKKSFKDIKNKKLRETITRYAVGLIHPNLTFNRTATEAIRDKVASQVEEVVLVVKKGAIIAREGDPIDETVLKKLKAIKAAGRSELNVYKLVGLSLILLLLILTVWRYAVPYKTYIKKVKRLFVLIVTVTVSMTVLVYFFLFIADSLADKLNMPPLNSAEAYYFAIPFAAGATLLALLVDANIAVLFSIPLSVIVGIATGNSLHFLLYALISSLSAIYGVSHYKQRTVLIKAGLIIALFNVAAVLALALFFDRLYPLRQTFFAMGCGFLGGIVTSAIVSFSLPLLENTFDILTDIKLLELSDINNPLLRELAIHAPGTYTHSVILGNMAEAAAESIGANALFCRVGAYYHDIGKIKMPKYFIENQAPGENKHEELSPHMSGLIIINHVKEGIELAREHNLSEAIQDIIPQHHGTRLITYFYNKAKEMESPESSEIREEDFRYPGPKPQTKEAAIFMLADAVEAASRTLEEPSPARVKGMIKDVVNSIVLDGQLDQCNLTFSDVEKISHRFYRVLMGMMHSRVKYPGFDFEKSTSRKKENGAPKKSQ